MTLTEVRHNIFICYDDHYAGVINPCSINRVDRDDGIWPGKLSQYTDNIRRSNKYLHVILVALLLRTLVKKKNTHSTLLTLLFFKVCCYYVVQYSRHGLEGLQRHFVGWNMFLTAHVFSIQWLLYPAAPFFRRCDYSQAPTGRHSQSYCFKFQLHFIQNTTKDLRFKKN